jgi:lambda family phage portal protein
MREVKAPERKRTWADRAGEFADSIVSIFAPVAGAKRRAFRVRMSSIDLENKDNRTGSHTRGGSWIGSRLSPDNEAEQDLDSNREKSRELYKTQAIGGAVDSRTSLVVSYGFTPQARIQERAGLATKEQAKTWNQELEDVYAQVAPSICQTGKRSLWQLLSLAENHHGFDGESLTIQSDRGDAEKPIPLTLAIVDPMRLQTPPDKIGNPLIRLGIEYDASGKIVAYHIRNSHPGDTTQSDQSFTRYPADRVLHVFHAMQAEQTRGLPWLIRAIDLAKDSGDLDEAALIAAQVEACAAAFVTDQFGNPADNATRAATGTTGSYRLQEIRPGGIHYLDSGTQVSFATPTKTNGYPGLQEWNHHKMAAAINYPFEMLTKNWTGLSFAGGRLSLAEARQFCKVKQQLLREMWLCKVWERMVFEAVAVGACSIPARLYNKARWWFNRHEWTAPAWPFSITPGEEIKAAVLAVDENIRTKASVCAEYGGDMEEVFEQRREERRKEKEFGIDPITSEIKPADQEARPAEEVEMERAAA